MGEQSQMKKQDSTYRMLRGAAARTLLLLGLACLLAAPAELLAGHNDAGSPDHDGDLDRDNNHPLITILEPKFEHTYSRERLHARIRLSRDADPETFEAHLNGKDVSTFFSQAGGSEFGPGCDKEAWLPDADLLQGTNILLINVMGPHQSTGAARAKFECDSGLLGSNTPVTRMIAGVAVNALNLPKGADPSDINNFQIIIGPGPGFPTIIYNAAKLSCPAGLNSVQVLALGRKTLEPEQAVAGNTDHPGQACFGDAGSLANFLKDLPQGDLVIANSFYGAMPRLNTTAIGGTDFSTKPDVTPRYYNVIGVAGAAPGQAYESYQPIYVGVANIPSLVGSLMLDNNQNYFFVPSEYRDVNVIPNDPAFPNTATATVLYEGEPFRVSLPSGVNGGFMFFLIDRQKGYVQSAALFPTNSSDATQSERARQNLIYALTQSSPYFMFILTTVGAPFSSPAQVNQAIWDAVNSRGGNGYIMAKLIRPSGGGPPPTYTLVSSTDPAYPIGEVIENSSLWTTEQQTGEVHMLLGRNKQHQWSVRTGMSESTSSPLRFGWTRVGFQQAQDWPAWTADQQRAYNDLTSTNNNYPSIGRALGCNQSPTQPCQAIRSYYDGGIGGTGQVPAVAFLDYNGLKYHPNPDYSEQAFNAVRQQLAAEQGYLRNVYILYSLFLQLANDPSGNNIQQQLAAATGQIEESLRQGYGDNALIIERLTQASAITALFRSIPYVGPAFSAVSTVLSAATLFIPSYTGVPDSYSVTLNQLLQQNARFGTDLTNSTITLFTSIVNDWGKLQTIGSGYGAQKAPWYMCATCRDSNVPRSAIPMIALGAKRRFYSQLLPKVYSLHGLNGRTEQNPAQITGQVRVNQNGHGYCIPYKPYESSPGASWIIYPNITTLLMRDFYIITQTKTDSEYPFPKVLRFPSDSLLTQLFTAPAINSDGTLGGGAGFMKDRFVSGIGGRTLLPLISGYIPTAYCGP
jgi:hypothetical protein